METKLLTVRAPADMDFEDFAQAALAADLACYTAPADQADFPRLRSVIAAFPQGFRIYFDEDAPVGYTGWYPVGREIFDRLHDAPETLKHRGEITPLSSLSPDGDYLYLFNYSLIDALHKTPQSRALIRDYAQTINAASYKGLAAVTVSPHGVRVAEKFGMRYRGDMTHDGEVEGVYTLQLGERL